LIIAHKINQLQLVANRSLFMIIMKFPRVLRAGV